MKKALLLLLVVLVIVTGIPVLVSGMGSMGCADCPPGVLFMATTCLAVLSGGAALVAAALVLAFGTPGPRRVGRSRDAPLLRPPQLA